MGGGVSQVCRCIYKSARLISDVGAPLGTLL